MTKTQKTLISILISAPPVLLIAGGIGVVIPNSGVALPLDFVVGVSIGFAVRSLIDFLKPGENHARN